MSTAGLAVAPANLAGAAPAPVVDLDTRLAIASAAMTLRLEQAQLVFDVNTAHQPEPEPAVDYEAPTLPALDPAPAPQSSPLAGIYLAAIDVIRERGWTRDGLRDEQGAVCTIGAIRAAAGPDRGLADGACAALLDAIQTQFIAETIPAWNDQQTSADTVIRMLHTAASRA